MALTLQLRTSPDQTVAPLVNGHPLAASTPLAALPALIELQADPLETGKRLTQALGGAALLDRLDADPDRLLLIDADDGARSFPWEYAALSNRQLLATQYAALRLVDQPAAPPVSGPLNFVVLAADPLVDEHGEPREGYRLQVDNELRQVREVLMRSGIALQAQRVPPVKVALKSALLRGPALLHLTCHGDVVPTPSGPLAILLLEDDDGQADRLRGIDLVAMPPRGVLQGVVLSACHTAQGTEADLAYALVRSGVPFALGMQGEFPDPLSGALAAAFYETLLAGHSPAEALRQARQTLLMKRPEYAGLPVVYVARDSWKPLPLQSGQPLVGGLGLPGRIELSSEVQPPRPLLGRNRELRDLARLYSRGGRVVTVCGAGGIGKTALAAAFAERFAWRWPQGARTISFASDVINAAAFRGALLRALRGEAEAHSLAAADAEAQITALLAAARDWDGLLLLDNYESVLQGVEARSPEAEAVHRLTAQLAEGGARLLLTSRQQPAHLSGETLYPGHDDQLAGLRQAAAAELFMEQCTRARDRSTAHLRLAADIARATDGHPLAIALLAGEYDDSPVSPAAFLAGWQAELAAAERAGLAPHHRTFGAAFARSYDRLTPDRQRQLRALSVFGFPFFAEGAALVASFPHALGGNPEAHPTTQASFPHALGGNPEAHPTTQASFPHALGGNPEAHPTTQASFPHALGGNPEAHPTTQASFPHALGGNPEAHPTTQASFPHALGGNPEAHPTTQASFPHALGGNPEAHPTTQASFPHALGGNPEAERSESASPRTPHRADAAGGASASFPHALGGNPEAERSESASPRTPHRADAAGGASASFPHALGGNPEAHPTTQASFPHALGGFPTEAFGNDAADQRDSSMVSLDARQKHSGMTVEQLSSAKENLAYFTHRNLLEVDGRFEDGTPATYRFQPALRQEIVRRAQAAPPGMAAIRRPEAAGYAAYGEWLARRGYGDMWKEASLARLVQVSMPALDAAAAALTGTDRLWHIRRLAWIKQAFGENQSALELLTQVVSPDAPLPDPAADPEGAKADSSLRFELARLMVTRGDLDRALQLYQESLQLKEQLGDKQGKAASLHQMAAVFLTRGDLDRALQLYQESLQLDEQLGDKQGKAASLSNMAQVYVTRGDLDRALQLYQESLQLKEQLGDKQGKAASLSNMAQVYVTRGDLDRALQLYQESLQLKEQLGDKQGKAASLHQMAAVFLTRGDLDRALQLYQESLQLKEQLGDKQGKAASLHQMAAVFLTRGDLDRALQLYQESLQLKEQLGDKQGKAASLHQMAAVFLTRGDLDRALQLYQESLQLLEQLGDKQGKAASLHNMANILMARNQWAESETVLLEARQLATQVGSLEHAAFATVKLGQVVQARGNHAAALARYREGLALFERIGMPRESAQVRQMIAQLEGGAAPSGNPLRQAIDCARNAAQRGQVQDAIAAQEEAVALARQLGEEREALVNLSVLLYNLGGYYGQANRHEDAVRALEEVVALDEQTGHPDLEQDRQALAQARRLAALSPEERAQLQDAGSDDEDAAIDPDNLPPEVRAQLEAAAREFQQHLQSLPPEERARAEAEMRRAVEQFQAMSPEQRAQLEAAQRAGAQRQKIESLADQARDGALAALRGQTDRAALIGQLQTVAAQAADGETPGSPWLELAQYLRAVAALLAGEPVPPVPAAYAAHFAAIQNG